MSPISSESPAKTPHPLTDRLWALGVFVALGLAFWPIWNWLAESLLHREQLYTGATVLVVAGIHHWRNRARAITLKLEFGSLSLVLISVSFALVGLAPWYRPLSLLAACLALLAAILFLFGDGAWRPASKAVAVFGVFVMLIWLTPVFDWPLRKLAGQNVAWIFQKLGQTAELSLADQNEQTSLLLKVGGKPFVVAPECNGFGVISSALLLSLVVLVLQRKPLFDKALDLIVGLAMAFVANVLRITLIILLAPHVSDYHLMHETVGLIVFYGALGLIWIWLHPRKRMTNNE